VGSRVDQIGEGRHTVSAEYLAVFLEFVAECGLDASSVLASAGLSPEEVVQLPKAGEGRLVSEGPWQVVVELRSLDDRSVIVRYEKTNGQWAVGSGYAITRPDS